GRRCGSWIEREDGPPDLAVGQGEQLARTGAGRVHPKHPRGDGIVSTAMRHGGLHDDDGELGWFKALAAPLAEIKGRSLVGGKENRQPCMTHNRAGPHVKTVATHAGEMALLVLQFEPAVPFAEQFHLKRERSGIEPAAPATE